MSRLRELFTLRRPALPEGGSVIGSQTASVVGWRAAFVSRSGLLIVLGTSAVVIVSRTAPGTEFGFDYHGIWRGAQLLLAGQAPYLAPNGHALLVAANSFVSPPVLAWLAAILSPLPFHVSTAVWDFAGAACFAGALRIVGVRDWRVYVMATCSFPFISSLIMGQPDGLFALGAAVAWRYRGDRRSALAVGALIAAKLVAWPLLIWLLVTKRSRCLLMALATTVGLLVLSWAPIGFAGMSGYARLLSVDARAFATRSHSITALLMRLGMAEGSAIAVTAVVAIGFALLIVRLGRGSDLAWFTAALALGLFISPMLWTHYLVLLFVPLAISRPRFDWAWLVAGTAFVLSPVEPVAYVWQLLVVLAAAGTMAVAASLGSRTDPANVARATDGLPEPVWAVRSGVQ
jgi:alpha-1,2-mannosyltransferase